MSAKDWSCVTMQPAARQFRLLAQLAHCVPPALRPRGFKSCSWGLLVHSMADVPPLGDQSHYEVLGLDEDASQDDIVRAYRQRALEEHPDKGGDKDRFDELSKAYAVLFDQKKREAYDEQLAKEREREELVEGGRSFRTWPRRAGSNSTCCDAEPGPTFEER